MLLLSAPCATYALSSYTEQSYDCNLCRTTQSVVFEDALAFVIKKQSNNLKTSLLIVPKKHMCSFDELNLDTKADQQILIHLLSLAQMIATRLTGSQSYRITMNNGNELQDAPHFCIVFESHDALQKA
jgi:diadenosine tetraphosphate (Ap4A) HIT family hydrolase